LVNNPWIKTISDVGDICNNNNTKNDKQDKNDYSKPKAFLNEKNKYSPVSRILLTGFFELNNNNNNKNKNKLDDKEVDNASDNNDSLDKSDLKKILKHLTTIMIQTKNKTNKP
jgi:hypothetical protein